MLDMSACLVSDKGGGHGLLIRAAGTDGDTVSAGDREGLGKESDHFSGPLLGFLGADDLGNLEGEGLVENDTFLISEK